MGNKDRVLSLVIKIIDPKKATWIWDAHMHDKKALDLVGVEVWGITDGDLQEKVDELEAIIEKHGMGEE
jgi:hypothetical protein